VSQEPHKKTTLNKNYQQEVKASSKQPHFEEEGKNMAINPMSARKVTFNLGGNSLRKRAHIAQIWKGRGVIHIRISWERSDSH
jgi:hypothetical protein